MSHLASVGAVFVGVAAAVFVFYWNLRNHSEKFQETKRADMETTRSRLLYQIFVEGSLENLAQWMRLARRGGGFAGVPDTLRAFLMNQQTRENVQDAVKDAFEKSPLTPEDMEVLRESSGKTVENFQRYEQIREDYHLGWKQEEECSDEILQLGVLALVVGLGLVGSAAGGLDHASLSSDAVVLLGVVVFFVLLFSVQRFVTAYGKFKEGRLAQKRFEALIHSELYEISPAEISQEGPTQ